MPASPGRRWAAVTAGVLALLALHAVLVWPAHGFLLSDTTGYLANARWLAGEAGSTWQGESSFYHPLWSLLVAPLYLVFDLPREVQVGALVLNAALATAVFPAALVLGRRVFRLPFPAAFAAAAVAATYPAVLLLAGYEWAEPLYQLLFVGWALAVAAAFARPDLATSVGLGVAAAALNATHPRGLGTVAVTAVTLLVLARRRRVVLAGLGAMVVLFLLTRLLNAALLDAIYSETSAGVEGDVLGRLTDPELLLGAGKALVGQLWYLTVSTLGLVPLGLFWLAAHRRVDRSVALVLLAGVGATLASSALQMADGTRVDHMVYGRYVEGAVPVLLVAGAAAAVTWRRALPRLFVGVVGFGALLAAALVGMRGGDSFAGFVMPLNVTGVLVGEIHESRLDVARLSLVAVLAGAAVVACARWRAVVGLGLATLLFAGAAVSVQGRTLRPFDERWAGFIQLPDVVRDIDGGPVGYDLAAHDEEPANLYQLELADVGVRFFDSREEPPATDLVIARPRWPVGRAAGARLVSTEMTKYRQALWVMPGPLQDELAADGALVPDKIADPLPPEARRQGVTTDLPDAMAPGAERVVDVDVRHAGGAAAWLPAGAIPNVLKGTVRLGTRWYAEGREVRGPTADLGRVLAPGGSDTLELELKAPRQPGRYRVEVGLLQEGFLWFDDPQELTVVVR